MKSKLLAIVGPTATGKTATAVRLAHQLNGSIISLDSMAVYKGLDIGTAKPSLEERQGIPHYLLDVLEPEQPFSVAQYEILARQAIREIQAQGRLPLLVGGTGLYLKAVTEKNNFAQSQPNPALRQKWEQIYAQKGRDYVYACLQKADPETAQRLHPNDQKRIIRALEVWEATGQPMSALVSNQPETLYKLQIFGLYLEREKLYERINQRVDLMLEQGLLEEVKKLQGRVNATAWQAIGYKELAAYLEGKLNWNEAVELIKRESRRLAKRQMTWFRRDPRIKWIEAGTAEVTAVQILQQLDWGEE
ncbi:MAG: tRNA (adenosine(37)-N6)-dimethylallyltransferase MiaA [Clostridia bacterium]|nr:tRNA (adenosine(37)-N6)-dimethylallyltransferase MiaA [Clostridia bacterium]